jgi:hypothetical protein
MSLLFDAISRRRGRQVHGATSLQADVRQPLPGTVTSDLLPSAAKRWFETFIAPVLQSARLFILCVLFGLIAVVEGVALSMLIPLHDKVPYLAEINEDDGKLRESAKFKPLTNEGVKQRQLEYFLKLWVRWVIPINSQTNSNLPKAAGWVRGAAAHELNDWLEKIDRPAERQIKEPNLTREIHKMVVTYGQGRTAFIHLELIERNAGIETRRIKKLLQLDFELLPEAVTDDNPIGLSPVHFTVADE